MKSPTLRFRIKNLIRRFRGWLVRLIREPGIEITCQCGQSVVFIDAETCSDVHLENISFKCGCKNGFVFSLVLPKKPCDGNHAGAPCADEECWLRKFEKLWYDHYVLPENCRPTFVVPKMLEEQFKREFAIKGVKVITEEDMYER